MIGLTPQTRVKRVSRQQHEVMSCLDCVNNNNSLIGYEFVQQSLPLRFILVDTNSGTINRVPLNHKEYHFID